VTLTIFKGSHVKLTTTTTLKIVLACVVGSILSGIINNHGQLHMVSFKDDQLHKASFKDGQLHMASFKDGQLHMASFQDGQLHTK
jgi:hypothetical protein